MTKPVNTPPKVSYRMVLHFTLCFCCCCFFSSGYLSTSDPHHSDTCCSISSTDLGIPSCCSTNTVPCQRKSYLQILPVVMKIHLYQQICGSFSDKVFKSVEKCPKIDNEEITKFSHIHNVYQLQSTKQDILPL